jgi:hypothetical protein
MRCKCDCSYKLGMMEIKYHNDMSELCNKFDRLRRDMAYFQFTLTGDRKHIEKYEFERKNGGF